MDILKFYGLVEEAAPEEEAVLNLVSTLKKFFCDDPTRERATLSEFLEMAEEFHMV
jgi:hypothetical protein